MDIDINGIFHFFEIGKYMLVLFSKSRNDFSSHISYNFPSSQTLYKSLPSPWDQAIFFHLLRLEA